MKTRLFTTFITLLAMALPFATTLNARQSANTVRVGMLLRQGSDGDLGARLAADEINNASSTYRFELIYPDNVPTRPEEVRDALDSLTRQQARAIIGPADNTLAFANLEPLARVGVPVLTLATADTLTDLDVTNNIMRFRAAERYYSSAAVDYLVNDLGKRNVALIQTNVESTEAAVAFEAALATYGQVPALKVQLVDSTTLGDQIAPLAAVRPDAIAMWGSAADVNFALTALYSAGWTGDFFYRHAQEALVQNQLDLNQAIGVIGATGWLYSTPTELSRQFLINYVSRYGRIPSDEAAAAYDAVYTLAGQVQTVGMEMPALYEALLGMSTVFTVQGRLNPSEYQNGDFSRSVTLYQVGRLGGTAIIARYQDNIRLPDDDLLAQELDPVAAIGTPTFTPLPTDIPTITPTPSNTPTRVQITVTQTEINVRAGAGEFFNSLGVLQQGATATVVGATASFDWLVIQYRGGIGWVSAQVVEVFDPGGLMSQVPIIDPLPTPIGGVSVTPAVSVADVVIENVSLSPPQPVPGQSFIATVNLRNLGTADSGAFAVQGFFSPGPVYSTNYIASFAPGTTASLSLPITLTGAGEFVADVIADINNEVNEGATGEGNNSFRVNYRLEYPVIAQETSFSIFAPSTIDLAGGTPDLEWYGTGLNVINGARMGFITGANYDSAFSTVVDTGLITNAFGVSDFELFPGAIVGIITAEGSRALLRIEGRTETMLTMSYRVYGN